MLLQTGFNGTLFFILNLVILNTNPPLTLWFITKSINRVKVVLIQWYVSAWTVTKEVME